MRKTAAVRKLKSQPKPQLTDAEVQRIAEKLAVALEHRAEDIGLITLLFDHLQTLVIEDEDISLPIYVIKRSLFVGTTEADEAQRQFQSRAYANRGTLLLWPYERKEGHH